MGTDLGETEEGIALVSAQAGTIITPKQNQSDMCGSCGALIGQVYCGSCGQKNDDLRRSLWRLIAESLGGIFSFESRMWRTWGALLLKPGKVAREYADGARSRYSPPIRVYIVISFLFFAFIAFSNTNFLSFEVTPKQTAQKSDQPLSPGGQDAKGTLVDGVIVGAMDNPKQTFSQKYKFNMSLFARDDKLYKMTDQEMEEFTSFIQDDEAIDVQINKQDVDTKKVLAILLTNPQKFNRVFNTWLPRAMFFMVPFAMIFGWLFIRGKNALLYDHLIHAIYIHCVFLLALIISLLLSRLVPGYFVFLALFGFMTFHLIFSVKKMFSRGWIKTVWTTLGTGFLYSFLLFIILIVISGYSIIQAVTDAGLVT